MRVALVHDDLVQWGGAERVLEGLTEIFPEAPIFTSVFDRNNKELNKRFGSKKIVTSFIQKIPGWRSLYKILLPIYPIAFEQFDFSQFDLVISQTTRFAKSIITKPQTKHICYCHTPPRFLWHYSEEIHFGIAEILISKLRIYDQISARRVDLFLAGSQNAKRRIKDVYKPKALSCAHKQSLQLADKQDLRVVYPFIDLERFAGVETFDGGYFLVISRLNRYKKIDLVVEACRQLGLPLKIIGSGPQLEKLKKIGGEIEFLDSLDDQMVIQVLAGCRALIVPGVEDFGLTSLEAQALGKPVIAYKQGGVLETVIDGKTGILFDNQTVKSLMTTLSKMNFTKINSIDCKENAKNFSKEKFKIEFKQIVDSM